MARKPYKTNPYSTRQQLIRGEPFLITAHNKKNCAQKMCAIARSALNEGLNKPTFKSYLCISLKDSEEQRYIVEVTPQ